MFHVASAKSYIEYWDAARALVLGNPRSYIGSYNATPTNNFSVPNERWFAIEHPENFGSGTDLANRIKSIIDGTAGGPVPALVMLDEVNSGTRLTVAQCAKILRGTPYASRFGAFLANSPAGMSGLDATPPPWDPNDPTLQGAVTELLKTNAFVSAELYCVQSDLVSDAQTATRFRGGTYGGKAYGDQFYWLIALKNSLTSYSVITPVINVSQVQGYYPTPADVQQMLRAWMSDSTLRNPYGLLDAPFGGIGSWHWVEDETHSDLYSETLDSSFLDAWNWYVRDEQPSGSVFIPTIYSLPLKYSSYSPTGAITWGPPGHYDIYRRSDTSSIEHKYLLNNTWSLWEDLGGGVIADPGVVAWANGRVDLFVTGSDNQLWHNAYDGVWHGWEPLGGACAWGPGAVTWGVGFLDAHVVAVDLNMWHIAWNNNQWTAFENLGQPPGGATLAPSGVSWYSGHEDVFVRGADGALWHRWTFSWPTWTYAWESLGGVIYSSPSACTWGNGHISVFAAGYDGTQYALYHKMLYGGAWQPWEYLGAPKGGMDGSPGAVTVTTGTGTGAPGPIRVFVRGAETGHVWAKAYEPARGGWNEWTIERTNW